MTATNRLSKLVKATAKLPKGIRSTLWSKAFGRIVPMVKGSANIRYLEGIIRKVVVKNRENHRAMQNHIGQVHACAMALIAETATESFVTGMNVRFLYCVNQKDSKSLILNAHLKSTMTAVATLTDEQQKLMQTSKKVKPSFRWS